MFACHCKLLYLVYFVDIVYSVAMEPVKLSLYVMMY